ncbi:trimeric intracellular cation channel family protein [Chthonobacter rhizosphaerae]|uniref:trimeric intracellular cation channel family protein n=1 Tax=Chthonobacter rhizosphaerae TaxID=2735553 RepID=UPI0015EF9C0A|nr:trimeric intracellular cation channel family protein [Chthonobacter rhizosphaerae]
MATAWVLPLLDYLGVAVFAVSGGLAASRKQLDLVAFCFFGVATGVGGGTLRDILLGALPVFWIIDQTYVVVAVAAAALVFFSAHVFHETWSRYRLLLWADAVGLSAYAVMGAAKATEAGAPPVPAVMLGALTACFGGVIRDILANEPSVLLRREIYITAAIAGAAVFVGAAEAGAPLALSALAGGLTAFAIRGGALLHGWSLPVYRNPPGRPVAETEERRRGPRR